VALEECRQPIRCHSSARQRGRDFEIENRGNDDLVAASKEGQAMPQGCLVAGSPFRRAATATEASRT
jgi:hypothetical protein